MTILCRSVQTAFRNIILLLPNRFPYKIAIFFEFVYLAEKYLFMPEMKGRLANLRGICSFLFHRLKDL